MVGVEVGVVEDKEEVVEAGIECYEVDVMKHEDYSSIFSMQR